MAAAWPHNGDTGLCPNLERDLIAVTGGTEDLKGALCATPVFLVYRLEAGRSIAQLLIADALANYAMGHAAALGIRTAIFLLDADNSKMQRFVEARGGRRQEGVLYRIDI